MGECDPLRDERFWQAVEPTLFERARLDRIPEEVDSLFALLGWRDGSELRQKVAFDLGSGKGHFAIELGRRGVRVTGVDLADRYVAKARETAAAAGLSDHVRFEQDDAFAFLRRRAAGEASLVTLLFTTLLGYGSQADDEELLRQCRRVLQPGGSLVIETATPALLAKFAETGHEGVKRRITLGNGDCRAKLAYELPNGDGCSIAIKVYTPAELLVLAQAADFHATLYAGYGGATINDSSDRCLAVFRRPS